MNASKTIYFVYINEDYLYDNNYRQDEFNHDIFNEMLELELFLKAKYVNIDYNILYFNFIKHDIPANSNIINIVLNTTTIYNENDGSACEYLRAYCGQILSRLFHTETSLVALLQFNLYV